MTLARREGNMTPAGATPDFPRHHEFLAMRNIWRSFHNNIFDRISFDRGVMP